MKTALVLATAIVMASSPAWAQPDSIELSNNITGDGRLVIWPDHYGAVTTWLWPLAGSNSDFYDPAGLSGEDSPTFAAALWMYAGGVDRVVFAAENADLWDTYNVGAGRPATIQYQRLNPLVGRARDGAGVVDTADSSFRAFGGGGNFDITFELEQWVEKPPAGSAVATFRQIYTLTNNSPNPAAFEIQRHWDLDLLWDASPEDVAGTTDAAGVTNPYMRDANGDPATPDVVCGSGNLTFDYVAGKSGFDGGGGTPMAYGSDFQIWDGFGYPTGWRNYTAGVGHAPVVGELPGAQPPGSVTPWDAFMSIEWQVALAGNGGTAQIEAITTYGSRTPLASGCTAPCAGDLDGDCDTDLADLGILLADFGCGTPGGPPPPCAGDLDGDGDTDLADLGILLADFGCQPAPVGLPIDLFLIRISQGHIQFTGIDPNNLGDPWADPVELAQVEDTDGTLGMITASSPGFWKWVGKGLVIVGSTTGGSLGGAAAGSALPGIGTAAGAIIGGGAGLLTSVGGSIVANSNEVSIQDVAIYDMIMVDTSSGPFDLARAIINGVLNDPGVTAHPMPGGGMLFRPSPGLFATSVIVDVNNVPLPNAQIEVGVIDVDGDPSTPSDQTVAVFFQDFARGIRLDDDIKLFLDNVVPAGTVGHGDPVRSRHIFAQTH